MSSSANIFDTITKSSGIALQKLEVELQKDVTGDQLTMDNLMKFQVNVNKWNIISQMGSSLVKATGDAMKGIIQRVN